MLYSYSLLELRSSRDWSKISISIFDQRFDGQVDRVLLGVCRPASETITILSVAKDSDKTLRVTRIAERPAVSVAPMRIMRSNVDDLLVAEPNGTLTVLTHGLREYNASTVGITGIVPHFLPQPPTLPSVGAMGVDCTSASMLTNRVVALRDPIRSAVTVELLDGSLSRVSIDFTPRDLLTKQCLEVLALTLPADWYFGLHLTFTDAWRSHRLSCDPKVEFEGFKSALTTILQVEPYQEGLARNDPWERLSCSASYTRLEDDLVLSGLQLPPRSPPIPPSTPKRPHALLAPVLNALHMLGEDLRLMVHRHDDVHRLAELICLIASIIRPEWTDYWKRFCPDVTAGWVYRLYLPTPSDGRSYSHARRFIIRR
jgi:anaphase-promoting complex subunit 1